jgi:hypothetical protein
MVTIPRDPIKRFAKYVAYQYVGLPALRAYKLYDDGKKAVKAVVRKGKVAVAATKEGWRVFIKPNL